MLLNGRYQKVGTLGTGSYGTVYKAIDTKATAGSRTIDPKYMELFTKHEKDIEMMDEMAPSEREALIGSLSKHELLLPENGKFEEGENKAPNEEEKGDDKLVAIKKFKMNAHCEREGIPFNALREIKLLQELNHPNIIKLSDAFYINRSMFIALEIMEGDLGEVVRN